MDSFQTETPTPKQDRAFSWVFRFVAFATQSSYHAVSTGILILLAYIALGNVIQGEYTIEQFVRQLILGLSQGSIYALIALGYTLVYGILFMINFAHGEVFTAGAYAGFFSLHAMEESGLLADHTVVALLLTFFAAVIASVMVAFFLERIAYRPLRSAPRLVPLITAIGASVTLQQLFLRLFGSSARRYPDVSLYIMPKVFSGLEKCRTVAGEEVCYQGLDIIRGIYEVNVLGMTLRLRPINFLVFFISLTMMLSLWFFIQRTKTGKAMRAVAEDKPTAQLMGINIDRVIVTTFVLGAAMAGAGAVLFALIPGNGQVSFGMGFTPGIKAFTAAVVGGIGNVPGAMFGGLFLGVVESTGPSMLGMDNQLKDVVAFSMLVFILIFRPTGIIGEALSEEKA
jgi:branched-chain amino acid transport system permease protein